MSRSMLVAIAVTVTVLCAGGAVACFLKASALRSEARWLMARGEAMAAEYNRSFDGAFADSELSSFEQRRGVLERALVWQRFQLVLVLGSVGSAFCAYLLYLYRRLRAQLVETTAPTAGIGNDQSVDGSASGQC